MPLLHRRPTCVRINELRAGVASMAWRHCRRHGAGLHSWFQMQVRGSPLAGSALKEAVGMDQKLQRAAPDDRVERVKRGASSNAETSGTKALETRFESGMLPSRGKVGN